MDEEQKDCWDLEVTTRTRLRVVFHESVDEKTARERLVVGNYEDIIDEERLAIGY